ncbi:hypothetical protein D3C83_291070 [compost metagenome]
MRVMITRVIVQPSNLIHHGLTNSPILAFSPVNRIKGQQAKPSCMLRQTWLATSNWVDFSSP